jgi:hypothetical protein
MRLSGVKTCEVFTPEQIREVIFDSGLNVQQLWVNEYTRSSDMIRNVLHETGRKTLASARALSQSSLIYPHWIEMLAYMRHIWIP